MLVCCHSWENKPSQGCHTSVETVGLSHQPGFLQPQHQHPAGSDLITNNMTRRNPNISNTNLHNLYWNKIFFNNFELILYILFRVRGDLQSISLKRFFSITKPRKEKFSQHLIYWHFSPGTSLTLKVSLREEKCLDKGFIRNWLSEQETQLIGSLV